MNTRKLQYAGHTAVTNFDGLPEDVAELRDGADLTIAYVVNPSVDLEMIRRWNLHPTLIADLEMVLTAYKAGHMDLAVKVIEKTLNAAKA